MSCEWPTSSSQFREFMAAKAATSIFLEPEKFKLMSLAEYVTCYPDLMAGAHVVRGLSSPVVVTGMGLECQLVAKTSEDRITPLQPNLDMLRILLSPMHPSLTVQQRGRKRSLVFYLHRPFYVKITVASYGLISVVARAESSKRWLSIFLATEFAIQRILETLPPGSPHPIVWSIVPTNFGVKTHLVNRAEAITRGVISEDSETLVDPYLVKFVHASNPAVGTSIAHAGPDNTFSEIVEQATRDASAPESLRLQFPVQTGVPNRSWGEVVASYGPLDGEKTGTSSSSLSSAASISLLNSAVRPTPRVVTYDHRPPSAVQPELSIQTHIHRNGSTLPQYEYQEIPDEAFSDTITPLFFECVETQRRSKRDRSLSGKGSNHPLTTKYTLQNLSRSTLALMKHASFCDAAESTLAQFRPIIYKEALLHSSKYAMRVSLDTKKGEATCKSAFSLSVALDGFQQLRLLIHRAEYTVDMIKRALEFLRGETIVYVNQNPAFIRKNTWESQLVQTLITAIRLKLFQTWTESVLSARIQNKTQLDNATCLAIQVEVLNRIQRALEHCKTYKSSHSHLSTRDWNNATDCHGRYKQYLNSKRAHKEFVKKQLETKPYYLGASLLATPSLSVAAAVAASTGTNSFTLAHAFNACNKFMKSKSSGGVLGSASSSSSSSVSAAAAGMFASLGAGAKRRKVSIKQQYQQHAYVSKQAMPVMLDASQSAILAGRFSDGHRVNQEDGNSMVLFFNQVKTESRETSRAPEDDDDDFGLRSTAMAARKPAPTLCLLTLLMLHLPEDTIGPAEDIHFDSIMNSSFEEPSHRGHWSEYFNWDLPDWMAF